MAYRPNQRPKHTLSVGNWSRVDYRDGESYVTASGGTLQISPEAFFDLAGSMISAYRNLERNRHMLRQKDEA